MLRENRLSNGRPIFKNIDLFWNVGNFEIEFDVLCVFGYYYLLFLVFLWDPVSNSVYMNRFKQICSDTFWSYSRNYMYIQVYIYIEIYVSKIHVYIYICIYLFL